MNPPSGTMHPERAAARGGSAGAAPTGRGGAVPRLAGYLLLPLLLSLLFTLALTLACLIPRSALERNARASAGAILPRGGYPRAFHIPSKAFQLDYYTDSIMLNLAYEADARHPLRSALADSETVSALDQRTLLMLGGLATADSLQHLSYARYWHGYLIYLRPLLVWLDHGGVLLLIGVLLGVLTLLLLVALFPADRALAIPLAAALVLTNVAAVVQSLQLVQTFVLAVGLSLWMARTRRRSASFHTVAFLLAGGLTAFFDVLTAPLMTWGLPLLVVVHVLHREGRLGGFRRGLGLVVRSAAAWGYAYVACWASKWVLTSALLGQSVIADAFEQVAFRAGSRATNVSLMVDALVGFAVPVRISAPLVNIGALLEFDNRARLMLNLGLYAALVVAALALLAAFRNRRLDGAFVALLVVVAAAPYAWYALTAEHAARHYWFTYRSQSITIAALGCAWFHAVDWAALARRVKRPFTKA